MVEQERLCLRDRGGARRHTPVRAGETLRCPERRLPLCSRSLGLGWAERLSQGGESPSGGIRPPPPCLRSVLLVGLCWQPAPLTHTHTHLTPLCLPPGLSLSQPLSSLSPPSSAPPLAPSSFWGSCLCSSVSISPLNPFSSHRFAPHLSLSLSFPPSQSLLPHTFLSQLPAPAAPLGFTLIFSYPSLCCLLAHPPRPHSVGLSPRSWEAQRECAGQSFTGGPWEPRMRGHHLAPTQKGGGKGQRGCGLSGQKEVTLLWPVHPRPQGPAGLLPPPDWGRVNTAASSSRYLYRGPGVGPVPTTAPALPCPPQPAPSQRGTSQQGDAAADTASLQSAQRPPGVLLGTPAASLGTQDAPLPWRHQSTNAALHTQLPMNVNTHSTENSKATVQNRDPCSCSHTEVISPHVGTECRPTCSQTPQRLRTPVPEMDMHTHREDSKHVADTPHRYKHPQNTSHTH